MDFKLKKKQL